MKLRGRFLWSIPLALLLTGCEGIIPSMVGDGLGFTYKLDPKYPEYLELCQTKAGAHIHSTVEDVRGVYGIPPKIGLVDIGYDFVELNLDKASPDGFYRFLNEIHGSGFYRFTLEDLNHPRCDAFYRGYKKFVNETLSRMRRMNQPPANIALRLEAIEDIFARNFGSKCIASTPIDVPAAKYRQEYIDYKKITRKEKPGDIDFTGKKFTSMDGEAIYAEEYRFTYIPLGARRMFKGGSFQHARLRCLTDGVREKYLPKIQEIFKPAKD